MIPQKKSETVRALIYDNNSKFYFVVHDYHDPENKGKWSTVGGHVQDDDVDQISCLKREISEELGMDANNKITIHSKVAEEERKNTKHYFYACSCEDYNFSNISREEILEEKLFSLKEIKELQDKGKLFFGKEYDWCEKIVLKK